jgi:hypothetical protein
MAGANDLAEDHLRTSARRIELGRCATHTEGRRSASRCVRPRCLLALALIAAIGCRSLPHAEGAPAAHRGPLVVTLVIDQLAAWEAAERLPLLPDDGGFARLTREGTWVREMRFAHALTETAPGHASLYTGVPPRENGIYTNELPLADGIRVPFVRDDGTHLVGPLGPLAAPGASATRLQVPALADRVRMQTPEAVVVTLSLKDRGAVFGGGQHPDAAIWYAQAEDALVTASNVASALPAWALPFATPEAMAARRGALWQPIDRSFVALHATTPDDQVGEADYLGLGIEFPHDFAHARQPGPAFRASPEADSLLLELALAAVDDTPRPGAPMLLAVSLSAHDYIGHLYGPASWEAWDELLRLDRSLARFFAGLDARLGPQGWSVLVTGDHGGGMLPELPRTALPWCADPDADRWRRPCSGGRIDSGKVLATARAAAQELLGQGDWLRGEDDAFLFYGADAMRLDGPSRARMDDRVRESLRRLPGVAEAFAGAAQPSVCPPGDALEALVCRTVVPSDGAAYLVVPRPGWAFNISLVPGSGANHGTPYLYDRAVPLLVRAPGRVPAGRVLDEPVSFATFARTAAALLGVRGFALEGRDLTSPDSKVSRGDA